MSSIDRFSQATASSSRPKANLATPTNDHPAPCESVAWADAQRFEDVRLGLLAASGKILPQTDPPVGGGEIPVDRQRALALGDALDGAIAVHSRHPQYGAGVRVVRPQSERLTEVGLGGTQSLDAVFGQPISDRGYIDPGATDQRVDIVRIEIESAVEVRARLVEELGGLTFVEERKPKEIVVHRIRVRGALGAARFGGGELLPEPIGEAGDDLVLHVEEIGDGLVEALGPEVRAGLGVDQLHVDAHAVSAALHAAFEHIAHVELAADLLQVDGLALVGEGGVAADDEGAGNAREVGRQALGHAVDEIFLLRIAADIGEGQHDEREARRLALFRRAQARRGRGAIEARPTRAHRRGSARAMFLSVLSPRSTNVSFEPVAHLLIGRPRRGNPARLADAFKPCGDIDPVAHQVAVALLDDVAEMDADAELDALLGRQAGVALDHAALHLDRAAHRVDDAAELDDRAVAGALDDAAMMQRRWSDR